MSYNATKPVNFKVFQHLSMLLLIFFLAGKVTVQTQATITRQVANSNDDATYNTTALNTPLHEIINRLGWANSSGLAIIVSDSAGLNKAYSQNGSSAKAPILAITYPASAFGTNSLAYRHFATS
jgi:cell division protein FtsL